MRSKKFLLPLAALLLTLVLAPAARAEDIRIVAPYVGVLSNSYSSDGVDLKDSGLMTGLYLQWIKPESYQWNAFLYYAPDVDYMKTLGVHCIFDYYFGPDWYGKFVAGAGLETLWNKMDAGSNIDGLSAFTMDYKVITPYLRAGKYFKTEIGHAEISLLPWAGIEPEWIRGDMSQTIDLSKYHSPDMEISSSMDDSHFYGIAGANLKVTLFHFVDLEGKYLATFDAKKAYSTFDGIANIFFSRSLGLSYRYKYMQSLDGTGSYSYHLFGLAYMF